MGVALGVEGVTGLAGRGHLQETVDTSMPCIAIISTTPVATRVTTRSSRARNACNALIHAAIPINNNAPRL